MENKIQIEPLKTKEFQIAGTLLSESMCTNPNHLAIFKTVDATAMAVQKKMFLMVLNNKRNTAFSAKLNDQIVGIMVYSSSKNCQIKPWKLIWEFPKLIAIFRHSLFRVLNWRMTWSKHDSAVPHIHFGPIAVAGAYQGKGIGRVMLTYFCDYLDRSNQLGYLETDKAENVLIYEKFGFKVTSEDEIYNVPNWFMHRYPK